MLSALLLTLQAFSASDGELAWQLPLPRLAGASVESLARADDLLLVEDSAHGITACRLSDGQPQWRLELDAALRQPPITAGGVVCLLAGARVLVVDRASGAARYDGSSGEVPTVAPVSDGELLYLPGQFGSRVRAIEMASGATRWEYLAPASLMSGPQLLPGGALLLALEDGTLRAVSAEAERWAVRVGRILGRPLIAGEIVFVATDQQALLALRSSSGEAIWKHLPGERLRGPAVLVSDLVLAAGERTLCAVDAATGLPRWTAVAQEQPMGGVGDVVLLRRTASASVLRDRSNGAILLDALPGAVYPMGEIVVEVRPTVLMGWRIQR